MISKNTYFCMQNFFQSMVANVSFYGAYRAAVPCWMQLPSKYIFLIDSGLLRNQSSRPAFLLALAYFMVNCHGVHVSHGFSVTS